MSAQVRRVNRVLRQNRAVMNRLIPAEKGKTTVSRSRLLQEGFDFSYHTHTHTTRNGRTYVFCYEFGYLPLENEVVMLVKREEKTT